MLSRTPTPVSALNALYEIGNSHRQIYTDGRALPREVNLPAYLGYSVGRWDRDTFVVETTGFNDKQPLDALGIRTASNCGLPSASCAATTATSTSR